MDAEIPDDKKATEHLANERTFLAWVRTSIAIMSLGFVVAKFGLWLRELSHVSAQPPPGPGWSGPIGMAMIAFGGALALMAAWRFHVVNRQIDREPLLGALQVIEYVPGRFHRRNPRRCRHRIILK